LDDVSSHKRSSAVFSMLQVDARTPRLITLYEVRESSSSILVHSQPIIVDAILAF
jgi:hypothetical protein